MHRKHTTGMIDIAHDRALFRVSDWRKIPGYTSVDSISSQLVKLAKVASSTRAIGVSVDLIRIDIESVDLDD